MIVPCGVGTSTLAPAIASFREIGTRRSSRLPWRRKWGWGRHSYFDENVASWSAVKAFFSLSSKPNFLAVLDAGGNFYPAESPAGRRRGGRQSAPRPPGMAVVKGTVSSCSIFAPRVGTSWRVCWRLPRWPNCLKRSANPPPPPPPPPKRSSKLNSTFGPPPPALAQGMGPSPSATGAHRFVGAAIAIVQLTFLGVA